MRGGGMLEIINDGPGDAKDERYERQEHGNPCHFGEGYDNTYPRHVVVR